MKNNFDLLNRPWAIDPRQFGEVGEFCRGLSINPDRPLDAGALTGGYPGSQPEVFRMVGDIAIISVSGIILKGMTLLTRLLQGTSSESVSLVFQRAVSDDQVKGIILLIDSPGGTIDGLDSLSRMIFNSRGQKPVVTLADGMMMSGALWVGSAADKVFMIDETTMIGGIGVVITHVDCSRFEDRIGIKTTEITAGKYKRIASDSEPLSSEGRQYLQDMADYYYTIFVNQVSKFRGIALPEAPTMGDEISKISFDRNLSQALDRFANGRTFIGQQAIKAVLADGIISLDRLVSKLAVGEFNEVKKTKPPVKASEIDTGKPTTPGTLSTVPASAPKKIEGKTEEKFSEKISPKEEVKMFNDGLTAEERSRLKSIDPALFAECQKAWNNDPKIREAYGNFYRFFGKSATASGPGPRQKRKMTREEIASKAVKDFGTIPGLREIYGNAASYHEALLEVHHQ